MARKSRKNMMPQVAVQEAVHLQKKEEHDSLCLSCGAGENADDGGDGSDSSSGVYHV